jgi:hypothetical protein
VVRSSPRLLLNCFSRRVPDFESFHGFGHGDTQSVFQGRLLDFGWFFGSGLWFFFWTLDLTGFSSGFGFGFSKDLVSVSFVGIG